MSPRLALKRAKCEAVEIVTSKHAAIEKICSSLLRREVHFDRKDAVARIMGAVFLDRAEEAERIDDDDEIFGETEDGAIWISRVDMNHDLFVGALVHECLHDSLRVARPTRAAHERGLSETLEHSLMRELQQAGVVDCLV